MAPEATPLKEEKRQVTTSLAAVVDGQKGAGGDGAKALKNPVWVERGARGCLLRRWEDDDVAVTWMGPG